ncbi:peptidase C39 family protein [Mesorhizobium sp.]|uniref:peptidase C39 family protein n=1 Tax=Mesorhizobium sp. TaxID=1871066 RepID=UPI003BAC9B73
MQRLHVNAADGMAVLDARADSWAALCAALPPDVARHVSALQAIAGVLGVVQHSAEGRPVAVMIGQRRPVAAMMRIVLFWTAPSFFAADTARVLEMLEKEAFSRAVLCLRADEDISRRIGAHSWQGRGAFHEHWIGIRPDRPDAIPPFYPQSAGFTCGPSALAMAMGGLDSAIQPDRTLEIDLWREATTIIGPTGPGGCDPYGLALAAHRRGLRVEVFMSSAQPIFLDRASTDERRGLMEFVQAGFKREAGLAGIPVERRAFAIDELGQALDRGLLALVLIDQAPMMGYTCPHWILVHGHGDGVYFINDPWIEPERFELPADVFDLSVAGPMLDRMAWYGTPAYRAAVLIGSAQRIG